MALRSVETSLREIQDLNISPLEQELERDKIWVRVEPCIHVPPTVYLLSMKHSHQNTLSAPKMVKFDLEY